MRLGGRQRRGLHANERGPRPQSGPGSVRGAGWLGSALNTRDGRTGLCGWGLRVDSCPRLAPRSVERERDPASRCSSAAMEREVLEKEMDVRGECCDPWLGSGGDTCLVIESL